MHPVCRKQKKRIEYALVHGPFLFCYRLYLAVLSTNYFYLQKLKNNNFKDGQPSAADKNFTNMRVAGSIQSTFSCFFCEWHRSYIGMKLRILRNITISNQNIYIAHNSLIS